MATSASILASHVRERGGSPIRIRDLGPLTVEIDGRPVDLGTTKQAALLSILALHAGHRVSAAKLVVAAWGEEADVPSTSLDSALWRLRNVVDPARCPTTRLKP